MKRSMIMTAMAVLLLLSAVPSYGYSDISESHWAYSYIEKMSDAGIIEGYEDGSFRPVKNVTYGEFIKMVYVACTGESLDQPENTHWALNYYNNSMKIGLFDGNDIKIELLDEIIPRKIMALIVSNGLNLTVDNHLSVLDSIDDVDEDTEYCYEIAASYIQGVLNGYPDGTFKPEEGLNRAEAAKTVYKLLKKSGTENIACKPIGCTTISNRDIYVDTYETELGYKGINSFVYSPKSECIGVYSDRIQDITLFVDNIKAMPVVNKDGIFWKEGNSYVYVFDVKGIYDESLKIGLAFGEYIEEIYYFKDAIDKG